MTHGTRRPGGDDGDLAEPGQPATKKKKAKLRPHDDEGVFLLRMTLAEVEPPVIRKLLIPGEMRLDELSAVLLLAMGWSGGHLHRFLQGPTSWSDPEFELEEAEDEAKYSLGELVAREGDRFEYEYDFGDNWVHEVVVEKVCPTEDGVHYPVCTDGAGACPPEDCGGPYGYADLVKALANPRHARHAELKEWLGGPHDPSAFDVKEVNDRLRQIT